MSTPDWIVGHPSDNKDFIGAIVVASLLVTSFFAGTGVMLYFWIKAWQGEDMHGKQMSYRGEKETDLIDLEAGKVIPGDESDEPSIVESTYFDWKIVKKSLLTIANSFKMAS